ncbi:MAG: zf-HC2 domain-containing protein [Dermatophilaceae bacterium]
MSTDHEQVHLLLGAYLLGGLGDTDRQAFEEHLPTCAMCRDELRRIAPVPGLLRRLQQPTLPPDQLLPALLSSVRAQRTRQRRRSLAQMAVAAVTVAALSLGAGLFLGRDPSSGTATTFAAPGRPGSACPAGPASWTSRGGRR